MAGSGQGNRWVTKTETQRWNFGKRPAKIDLPNVPHDFGNKTLGFLVFGEQCLCPRGDSEKLQAFGPRPRGEVGEGKPSPCTLVDRRIGREGLV